MVQEIDSAALRRQAEKILSRGVLGRSRFYSALLRYLLECSERGHAPKEIEVAAEVFSRGEAFDPSQDSMVRVYAHNLRQKLDQYYAAEGSGEPFRLAIPKGEYRLTLERAAAGPAPDDGAEGAPVQPAAALPAARVYAVPRTRLALVVILSLAAGLVLGRFSLPGGGDAASSYADVAASALWAPVTDDDTPVTLVVGDYFIFGERDRYGNVVRMVREFEINSSRDLDEHFMLEPEDADRYIDLDLTYLPTSTAFAMRGLMEVLSVTGKDIRVVPMSHLDTLTLRESHVVYVGYLSGLGMLSDFAFAGSALGVGETFDELVNRETGTSYLSEAGLPTAAGRYRDYGLFSTLPGPGGHQMVFVAGTRDEGLMQTAEAVTDPALFAESVAAVTSDTPAEPSAFELVYEVAGLDRTNLSATIVHAARRGDGRIAVGQLGP